MYHVMVRESSGVIRCYTTSPMLEGSSEKEILSAVRGQFPDGTRVMLIEADSNVREEAE